MTRNIRDISWKGACALSLRLCNMDQEQEGQTHPELLYVATHSWGGRDVEMLSDEEIIACPPEFQSNLEVPDTCHSGKWDGYWDGSIRSMTWTSNSSDAQLILCYIVAEERYTLEFVSGCKPSQYEDLFHEYTAPA